MILARNSAREHRRPSWGDYAQDSVPVLQQKIIEYLPQVTCADESSRVGNRRGKSFRVIPAQVTAKPQLMVNGSVIDQNIVDGYVSMERSWAKGDKIELRLPIQPRFIYANDKVQNLNNMVAIASGPLVYCFENGMNTDLDKLEMDTDSTGELKYQSDLLNGVNTVTYKASTGDEYTAVPYYAVGNFRSADYYKVWVPIPTKK